MPLNSSSRLKKSRGVYNFTDPQLLKREYRLVISVWITVYLMQWPATARGHFKVRADRNRATVYRPTAPEWKIEPDERPGNDAILLWSPNVCYPVTGDEIRLNVQTGRQHQSDLALEVASAPELKFGIGLTNTASLKTIHCSKIRTVSE